MVDEPVGPGGHDVTVNIKGNTEGLKKAAKEAEEHVANLRLRLNTLGQGSLLIANIFKNIGISLADLPKIAGLGLLIHQLNEIRVVGAAFANQMEQTMLGLKGIYGQQINVYDSQMKQVGVEEKLLVSQRAMAEQMEKMKTDALVTTATFSQITMYFQQALPVALSLGMSLDQTRGFVVSMVKTAGAMGVPLEHLNMEIRDALQGYVQMEDRMLRSLGLTTERLQQWKAQGPDVLIANLQKKMEAFEKTSQEAGDTWQGVTSSLQDFKEQLSGMVMAPAMDVIRKGLIAIRDSLGEVQNGVFVFNEGVLKVVNNLRWGFEQAAKVVVALGAAIFDVFQILSAMDSAAGGMLKYAAAIYAAVTAWQVLKGLLTAPWLKAALSGLGLAGGISPVTMWITGITLAVTLLMTLWNRFKGSVEKDLDELDQQTKDKEAEINKSKQREVNLRQTIEEVKTEEAVPEKYTGAPTKVSGIQQTNVLEGLAPAADDEKKWVEKMRTKLLPLAARYKEIADLYKKNDWAKEDILEALGKAQESEKAEIAKRMDEQETNLKNSQKVIEDDIKLQERKKSDALKRAERLKKAGLGSPESHDLVAQANDSYLEAEKQRQKRQNELDANLDAQKRLREERTISAIPQETPQEKALRERRETVRIESGLKATMLGIEKQLFDVEHRRRVQATGYYLGLHGLHQDELDKLEQELQKKIKLGQVTEAQRAMMVKAMKDRQEEERRQTIQAMLTGKMDAAGPEDIIKDEKGVYKFEESYARKKDMAKVWVQTQTFEEKQRQDAEVTRQQAIKEIETASAQLTKAEQELALLKESFDPQKRTQIPLKEREAEQAAEKVSQAYANAEAKLMELRKKQYEEQKAEDERQLQHRKAMGEATEQDELDRLYRLSKAREEDYKGRDKAAEEHFQKWKSLEQQLFDYRKGMGLISMEMEINRLRSIAGAANRTAEERMAAEQKVYDLEKSLIEKRRSAAKNLVKMGQEYLKEKYGEEEANRGRSQADWGRVADEAIMEKQRQYDRLKESAVNTPEQMQKMYDLDKELSDLRAARKELGTTREQIEGGRVPTPEQDRFRAMKYERDTLFNKKDRTAADEQRLAELTAAIPGQHEAAKAERLGETKTQREAAAGISPASEAFAGVAKALGLDTLPGKASKAFEQVATSYQELLTKMEGQAAVAGAKINTLLYEGFLGRLKQDLSDEVSRS